MIRILITLMFLPLCMQGIGCSSTPPSPTMRVKAKARVKPKIKQQVIPKIEPKQKFKPLCLSMLKGCEKIEQIKSRTAKINALLKQRDENFKIALKGLFSSLTPDESSPQVSVNYTFSPSEEDWKELSDQVKTEATVKVKYGSLKQRIGSERFNQIRSMITRLKKLSVRWKNFSKYGVSVMTLPNLQDKTTDDPPLSIQVPTSLVESIPELKPRPMYIYAALVNNKHGLNHHIVSEQEIKLNHYFSFDKKSLVLSLENKEEIKEHKVSFDTPLEELCDALRVELRIENNEKIRRTRRVKSSQRNPLSAPKSETDILSAAVRLLTAPNPEAQAKYTQADSEYSWQLGTWNLPPLNDAMKNYELTKIFKKLYPQEPATQLLCVRESGRMLYSMKTSEESMTDILKLLGIDPNILVPEESLRYKYTLLDSERSGFVEPEDLGEDLFRALSKRKNAVLKINTRFKDIPYKLNLNTDTGRKIVLPIQVDGLTSKRTLPKNARWRIVGLAETFPIMQEPIHNRLLAEVSRAGLVQISNIRYQKSYRDVSVGWKPFHVYEIILTGARENWLGQVNVKTSAKLWIHRDLPCDLAIDIETKTENETILMTQDARDVLDAKYQPPNQKYATGYSDPPNCQ